MLFTFLPSKEETIVIPKDSIRFRVIANSDEIRDQEIKLSVKKGIQEELYESVKNAKNIEEARKITQGKLGDYGRRIEQILEKEQASPEFQIHYGQNYFPKKEYHGVSYEEGFYESMVVTLGDGLGKNWWCVLFPPLCSLEAEEKEQGEEVEYKFFIKDLIDKYF